jgi:flagellar basal-body rod protein FlgB
MWNPISRQLESYMDLTAARQKLVASNIANASTPGYRAKDIDFHGEFVRSVDAGNIGVAPPAASGALAVVEVEGLATGNDGNNVSLERESRLLAENALRFNAASQLWRSELKQLKLAIDGGRNG